MTAKGINFWNNELYNLYTFTFILERYIQHSFKVLQRFFFIYDYVKILLTMFIYLSTELIFCIKFPYITKYIEWDNHSIICISWDTVKIFIPLNVLKVCLLQYYFNVCLEMFPSPYFGKWVTYVSYPKKCIETENYMRRNMNLTGMI